MQTTSLDPGKAPLFQLVVLAFQLVVPVVGPVQVSVHAGLIAPLGVADIELMTPADAKEVTATTASNAALRKPAITLPYPWSRPPCAIFCPFGLKSRV